ncbi:glycoside hydrolase family 88/105 protein [Prolixibacter denitrificans]|uniref:Family 88 glycosyl hydrolase n=2 Tax=Prolixibacter denitrificans TaxID=1541063 RepID=A0ABQ0ZFZ3_9BACT|nr:glycoside hydrolase family 88 protein [Prolixibacter denitrificans]GET20278.1 family 88 glycosyl hydrolase [Prolixibacter denitrificans]
MKLTMFNGKVLTLFLLGLTITQCAPSEKKDNSSDNRGLEMAVRMADSEIAHFPNAASVDFKPEGKWDYTGGLIASSMMKLWKVTGDQKYFDYAKSYADQFIGEDGTIKGYKRSDFNLDRLNSGKFLFPLYEKTHEEKYKKAIFILRDQLKDQPRTPEGGFWHKKRYTNQMWLDGLYMGAPFYAQFAKVFNQPKDFEDVINQFLIVNKHTYNPEIGLNYHGWDESKEQRWANPTTGCSSQFWGRAMGWYSMALVDALDFIPEDYPNRDKLIDILNQVAAGIAKWQDPKSGVWFQVLDQGNREGNYLEASASCMFVYTLLKATRLHYIDSNYNAVAVKGFDGILKNFIKENQDGTISLTNVCAVAGLGGNPYRDGTYEYYIKEPVRDNDPKGVGPFILACLEIKN